VSEEDEDVDPLPGLTLALAIAWGERANDKAVFQIAAALMADKVPLLEVYRFEYGTFKWFIERGYRVDKAMSLGGLTDPRYRPAYLEAQWERYQAEQAAHQEHIQHRAKAGKEKDIDDAGKSE
jgi:hypothetical protein